MDLETAARILYGPDGAEAALAKFPEQSRAKPGPAPSATGTTADRPARPVEATRNARIADMRARIVAANPSMSYADADAKAREYAGDEESEEQLASLRAATIEDMRRDEEEHRRRTAALYGEGESDGKSSGDLLKELHGMVERGEGWT